MTEATIYSWISQEKIDRGEVEGQSTEQALELKAARRRRQLETELAVSRKVNEVFLDQDLAPKPLPGDRVSDRAGNRCATGVRDARCLAVWLLRVEGQAAVGEDAQTSIARR
jgi:hypothetical protein